MASQDYLIARALIEQNLVRAMPLGGKEIKDKLEESENFKKLGEEVILNLLMRVFQSCLLYTSPSPRDRLKSRMPSSA